MSLINELKRRKVIRVGVTYLALAWLVVQVAETLLPAYGFGDAAIRVMVAVLAVGLVVALVLAWVFEWTPEGVKVTPDAEAEGEVIPAQRAPNLVIAIIVLIAAGLAAWLSFRSIDDGPIDPSTIAVLPFSTLGQEQADLFTDGMHVGVLTRLSEVRDLAVISRTSVMAYASSDMPLPDIAAELGAGWVLRADVQQAGDQVLVSASLSDAQQDRMVWADDYQRTLNTENIFDIQADITRQIVTSLEARLTTREEARVAAQPTENLEAYRLYQQGRDLLDRRAPDSMAQAVGYFEQAIDQDPEYALAWSGLGDALGTLYAYGYDRTPEAQARAEEANQKALALDSELAEAWAVKGLLLHAHRDIPAAMEAVERAIALQPSHAQAWTWRAFFHGLMGNNTESLESSTRAVQLNPRSAEAIVNYSSGLMNVGETEKALSEIQRALDLAPNWPNARMLSGIFLTQAGRPAEAIVHLEGLSVPWVGAGAETALAFAYLDLGREEDARGLLPVIEASGDMYAMAAMTAALTSVDEGYELLEQIEYPPEWTMFSLRSSHYELWNPEGRDPRYPPLLERFMRSWGVEP